MERLVHCVGRSWKVTSFVARDSSWKENGFSIVRYESGDLLKLLCCECVLWQGVCVTVNYWPFLNDCFTAVYFFSPILCMNRYIFLQTGNNVDNISMTHVSTVCPLCIEDVVCVSASTVIWMKGIVNICWCSNCSHHMTKEYVVELCLS